MDRVKQLSVVRSEGPNHLAAVYYGSRKRVNKVGKVVVG